VIDGEAGLGVEGFDGGRAAVHDEEYDAFGAGGEHGCFWGEGIGNGALSGQYGAEAQQAEARSGVLKDFATGAKRHSGESLMERSYRSYGWGIVGFVETTSDCGITGSCSQIDT
jgi:hypothetical protein